MKNQKLSFFCVVLTLLFVVNSNSSGITNVNVRVVFPFSATNVVLRLWNSSTKDFILSPTGRNEYSANLGKVEGNMLFNVFYDVPQYSLVKWWIGSGKRYIIDSIPHRFDAHGLKYGRIYINNQLLDNSFTVLNSSNNGLNISVKINADSTLTPYYDNSQIHIPIDERIPIEVDHRYAYRNLKVPASIHTIITGWVQALADNNIIDSSRIDVDFIRLYGFNGKDSTLIIPPKEYDTYNPANDGGLYLRYPFFPPCCDEHPSMPGSILTPGILTFFPSENISKVWHWWTGNVTINPLTYDNYKVVCLLKITGHAVVQAGIDFKYLKDNKIETNELGVSDWYFEKNGAWQEVIFDSRNFKNTMPNAVTRPEDAKNTALSYDWKSNSIYLKYEDLITGNYTLILYNTNGQTIYEIPVQITNPAGQSNYVLKEKISNTLIYNLTNSKGDSYTGKIIYH